MKRTRLCELLGIRYPILQGAMGWIADAELAAAVSHAGGLGVISPIFGPREGWPEYEREQIRKAKRLTNQPFGVNISLAEVLIQERIDVALEEGVQVITTAAGSPSLYTRYIREHGTKVLHVVFSVRHALRAEAEGVDAVIVSGFEGGGLLSKDEITTMTLVPQVVDAVKIPVVAAGGIADARGLVAALALGAEGVQMGTRFLATRECRVHPAYKQAILQANDTATVVTGRKGVIPARVLKSKLSERILELEETGATSEEISSFIGGGRLQSAAVEGNLDEGSPMCGAIAGLIKDIVSVSEVIRGLVEGYDKILARLSQT